MSNWNSCGRLRLKGNKTLMQSISVIIPTLNEAQNIEILLPYLKKLDDSIEIIVVDCNSTDDTIEKAKPFATVIQAPRGRGVQMNAGARVASGDILWFVHADCLPHKDSVSEMRKALTDPKVVGGGFEYNLVHPSLFFRYTEFASNRKNHILKLMYGDMGMFVRKELFHKMGGYKEIPIVEDMDFCRRLKKFGRIVIIPKRINTSTRRWQEEGVLKNLFRNYLLQIGWTVGVPPHILAKWYKFK